MSEETLITCWGRICRTVSGSAEKTARLARLRKCLTERVRPPDDTTLEHLAGQSLRLRNGSATGIFVALSGGDAVGKSALSIQLRELLQQRAASLTVGILPLDAYTMARAERKKRRLRGNDPDACRIDLVRDALLRLQRGDGTQFFDYDHARGCRVQRVSTLEPCDVIVVDGSHSFHDKIRDFMATKVFLYAPETISRELAFVVNVFERGYTPEEAEVNVEEEYRSYRRHVHPGIRYADTLIEVGPCWEKYLRRGEAPRASDL